MKIENCKCGQPAKISNAYNSTDRRWGYSVGCNCINISAPQCKTVVGATRKWNQFMRSSLTIQECATAFRCGIDLEAMLNQANTPRKCMVCSEVVTNGRCGCNRLYA